MIDRANELAALLAPTLLGGRSVESIQLPHSPEVALVVPCEANEVLDVWNAARQLVGETGRWPVIVCSWDAAISAETFEFFGPKGADPSPQAIIARSQTFDATTAIAGLQGDGEQITEPFAPIDDYGSFAQEQLEATEVLAGAAPSEAELVAAAGADATWQQVEQWLMHWRESNRASPAYDQGHLEWYQPVGQPTAVAFLPTANSWESLAYLSFWGADCVDGHAKTVALAHSWHERFGAELVAFWGTMLQFVVSKPPTTLDSAWTVAHEQFQLAPCTTLLPGVPLGEHARSLLNRDTWFVHERP